MDTGKVQRIDHKVPKGEASFEVMPGIKMFPRLAFELFFDFMPTVLIPAFKASLLAILENDNDDDDDGCLSPIPLIRTHGMIILKT